MAGKIKIVVNKKSPKGIVNIFGNIQNKVGTYDKDKLENFKNKLKDKSIEFSEKVFIMMDTVDDAITTITDDLFDKAIDSYNKLRLRDTSQKESMVNNDAENQIKEVDEYVPVNKIIPIRRINFEDLEPLGKIIDEEDDIYELQELKMELLFKEQEDEHSKESDITRKK